MAETKAFKGKGTKLYYRTDFNDDNSWVEVAEVVDIKLSKKRAEIDASHHASPDDYDESIPGTKKSGGVTFICNYLPDDPTHAAATGLDKLFEDGTKCEWKTVAPNQAQSTFKCKGYVGGLDPNFPVKDKVGLQVSIFGTGKSTYA